MPEVEHRGCRLHWDERGEGPPVLLIQGTGVSGDAWAPQLEALTASHRCIWFDNRGMARSQPVGDPVTVAQMAEDALAVLDAAGVDSAHVVGHSLGGLVAQHVALAAPQRVRTLSLLCTFSRGANATRLTLQMLWIGLRAQIGTRRSRRHAFLEMVCAPEALAGDRDALAERLSAAFGRDLADQPPVVMKQMRAMRAADATPRLGELAGIPTLVVNAVHDPIARPECGRALAAGIPGARYVELDGASHAVVVHEPERINALLLEHVGAAARATG